MVKIHFLQKVLKKWSSFRKKIKKNSRTGGGSGPYMEFSIIFFFELFPYETFSHKMLKWDAVLDANCDLKGFFTFN